MRTNLIVPAFLMIAMIVIAGCGAGRETVVYSEDRYDELANYTGIIIRTIDDKTYYFHRVEVDEIDKRFIYLRAWEKEDSEPIHYKFLKTETVILREVFSSKEATNYVLSIALTVGLFIAIILLF